MEDLFSDLSSVSDCDEECLLNLSTKKCKCFFIQTTHPEVVFEIPPAYELELPDVKSVKQKTLEEKTCETDSKGDDQYDKWVQTDTIEMQSEECSVDLPPTTREATYSESALERVLRHISAHLHRAQLQQWLAEQPARNASLTLNPSKRARSMRQLIMRKR
ncbi:unnamed protein product [Caenorhabditis sp. 36 PRJEB53466]|nr:unnamed protein product [Caenorhabditis sp. 36 PRJEB53466]